MTDPKELISQLRPLAEAAAVIDHNETAQWYDSGSLLGHGLHYPKNTRFIEATSPATIVALLDCMEALQAEVTNFAPFLKDGETPLQRLEREIKDNDSLLSLHAKVVQEKDAALARLAAMEAQEPVGWFFMQYINGPSGWGWYQGESRFPDNVYERESYKADPSNYKDIQTCYAAAGASPVEPADSMQDPTEFCWLIELMRPYGGNSLGYYHTGFTDLSGESRSTTSPHKAKRYATFKEADKIARNMLSKLGEWKAVEHGFHASVAQPSQALELSDQEIQAIWVETGLDECDPETFARAIITAINAKG